MSERSTKVKASELDRLEDRTDWNRLQELTDEEIENAVKEDPDQILLDKEWFEHAKLVTPESEKTRITIRLDNDIVDFFKEKGPGYQTRINKALRAYVLAKKMEKDER